MECHTGAYFRIFHPSFQRNDWVTCGLFCVVVNVFDIGKILEMFNKHVREIP